MLFQFFFIDKVLLCHARVFLGFILEIQLMGKLDTLKNLIDTSKIIQHLI